VALTDIHPFQEAAGRVRNRITWIRFAKWIRDSHWIAGLIAIFLVLALRQFYDWRSGEMWVTLTFCLLWLITGLIISLLSRPDALHALSIFDQKGHRKDEFSSAYSYLEGVSLTLGQKLHVSRAKKELNHALERLPEVLPLPTLSKMWILPLIALLFSASPLLRKAVNPGDTALSEEMIESAAAESERIRKATRDLSGLEALNDQEKAELEKLESSVNVAANEIANPEGQTAREVLSTLEARARAAEKLAEKLGLSNQDWASEEFIRELSQHTDTADLAIGIRDKNPELVVSQSEAIANILNQTDIRRETIDRFSIALERSIAKATAEDQTRPVGERIGNASQKLTARETAPAATEFEELASHFRRVVQRDDARKKLEKLAAQLRASGSQISGSKLESLKKIADTPKSLPDGLKPIEATPMTQQLQNLMAPQMPQPGQMSGPNMPIPGSLAKSPPTQKPGGNQPGGQGGQKEMLAPVPGQAPVPGNGDQGQGLAQQDGKDAARDGSQGGMLSAPIPGADPGMEAPGAGLGGSPGGASAATPGGGGKDAGSATMEMFEDKSQIAKAGKESRVNTLLNEGDSEFRTVEGGKAQAEQSRLSRKEILKNFIDVEAEALDEQPLPLTRRNQVLRYFSEIRRQLEEPETAAK